MTDLFLDCLVALKAMISLDIVAFFLGSVCMLTVCYGIIGFFKGL